MSTSWLQNVLSFGAAGRVEDAKAAVNEQLQRLQRQHESVLARRSQVETTLKGLIRTKQHALETLNRIHEVTDRITPRERQISLGGQLSPDSGSTIDMRAIDHTLSVGEQAGALAGGAAAGVATAAGAWAVAGAVGVASTGTAIGSLTGAAATSATLAWLGGGAAAAGGMGVMGGVAVLGGVTIIPAAALASLFMHSRANTQVKEIEERATQIASEHENLESMKAQLNAVEARTIELTRGLAKSSSTFENVLENTRGELGLTSWWGRLMNWVRRVLLRRQYSPTQLESIARLGRSATVLAQLIDQPLLDENGAAI